MELAIGSNNMELTQSMILAVAEPGCQRRKIMGEFEMDLKADILDSQEITREFQLLNCLDKKAEIQLKIWSEKNVFKETTLD